MAAGFVKRRDDNEIVWLHKTKSTASSARARDARWGDFLNIVESDGDGWSTIKWGSQQYFVRSENVAATRPLEIIFLDVGQGDGCIVVSPETRTDANAPANERERILVIDAGIANNMMQFLKWRFGKLKKVFQLHAAVLTHPDQDHYKGFQPIFEHENVRFEHVYHNGIMERAGDEILGPTDASDRFLTGVIETDEQVRQLYRLASTRGDKLYPKLIHTAMSARRVGNIAMLSTHTGEQNGGRSFMPGFAPGSGRDTVIEVLGPVVEPDAQGKARLRWFGDDIGSRAHNVGKTKNGHSVLLKLAFRGLRVLFGGDLNSPAEDFLLRHYGGIGATEPLANAVPQATQTFSVDIMKSCHHGSSDVTDEFLNASQPFAFVVSSGDEESHAHPRPDLLGRLGRAGRGEAPLILCTEILRSTREKGRSEDFAALRKLDKTIDDRRTSAANRKQAQKARAELQKRIQYRNVGVYGSITMRTDGTILEISFQLEKPRGVQRWHRYAYRHSDTEGWQPIAENGH